MTYFEVKRRLEAIQQFRELFVDYSNFTNRSEDNVPAQMVKRKMEPLKTLVVDSLSKIGLGRVVVRDTPAKGGRKIQINVIRAIFRERILQRYDIPDNTPLRMLDAGIAKYKQMMWVQQVQLFNPLFWVFHVILFLSRIPIYIFKHAGYDTNKIETNGAVKLLVVGLQLVCYYALIKWSGVLAFIPFDIVWP